MLITTSEVKSFLNITTTTFDSYIETITPTVLEDIYEYTNNRFIEIDQNGYNVVKENDFTFSTSSITLSAASTDDWTKRFLAGDTIYVEGTRFNDGFFTCSTRSSSVLTVSESMVAENSTDFGFTASVFRCKFPRNVKDTAAKMIWFRCNNSTAVNGNVTAESYGGYSVSYGNTASNNKSFGIYPAALLTGLKRVVSLK